MKKPFLIISLFIFVILSLAITQVVISNRVSTDGIDLEFLQNEITKYKKENTLIEEKVLEASALTNLSVKAKSLGFVENRSQIYLSNPLPLAFGNSSE